jgi:transcriptional regulator with XRE-family HTH domain
VRNFSDILYSLLQEKRLSQARFAALVGVTGPFVNQVLKGACPLPIEKITPWANALEITGDKRDEFITGAHLTAASPYLLERMMKLEAERDQIRTELRDLQTKLSEITRNRIHSRLKR